MDASLAPVARSSFPDIVGPKKSNTIVSIFARDVEHQSMSHHYHFVVHRLLTCASYQNLETTSAARTSSDFDHGDMLVSNRDTTVFPSPKPTEWWCHIRASDQ